MDMKSGREAGINMDTLADQNDIIESASENVHHDRKKKEE